MNGEKTLRQRTEFCHDDKLEVAEEYTSEKCIKASPAKNKRHVTKKLNSAFGG